MNIDALKATLRRAEGVRLKPYTDTTGHITIGIARNLTAVGISEAEADDLLMNDIARTIGAMQPQLAWALALDDVRARAFIELAFNMGAEGLLGFHTMLAFARAGEWDQCAGALMDSRWVGQVGPTRSGRIASMLRTGEDQL